jgi:HPt (histidine-containing phosphotransfer) domain-containing protein
MPELDHEVIAALQGFLKPDQFEGLLTDSIADISARVHRLGTCLNNADTVRARREAHDMISVAGSCGAQALSTLAREVERSCLRGAIADAIGDFGNMKLAATVAVDALRDLRDTLVTP